ncbi:MAG: DNA-3-methyladenine glycosylase I [Acidimicrobiia bacterium]|nr:DNA-3-methyladenine glycosylase I [Acidimicrobiia bacterium]
MAPDPVRCAWAGADPLMVEYHDVEWGVPQHDRIRLFEKLSLEGAQAGLSWRTILNKREGYRACFAGFDPVKVARFSDAKVEKLMLDARIVRNRAKITSTVSNAKALLALERELGDFSAYLWSFVDGSPIVNRWEPASQLPAHTEVSTALSKDLKRRGFRFVGPTTVYALMQAMGMVNDHAVTCYRHAELR